VSVAVGGTGVSVGVLVAVLVAVGEAVAVEVGAAVAVADGTTWSQVAEPEPAAPSDQEATTEISV
jgi:hypothetical protein